MYSIFCINVAVFFFLDNDHWANNKCSTKKWKEAEVYKMSINTCSAAMYCKEVQMCMDVV